MGDFFYAYKNNCDICCDIKTFIYLCEQKEKENEEISNVIVNTNTLSWLCVFTRECMDKTNGVVLTEEENSNRKTESGNI